MITEDYVSLETAKLLKENGFDSEECFAFYKEDGEMCFLQTFGDIADYNSETCVLAPTLQMAMKWLREVHNQTIVPGISLDDRTSGIINYYIVGIWYIPKNNGGAFCYTSPTPYNGYPSYEEACEAGKK